MNYNFTTKKQSKLRALLTLVALVCFCATSFAQWNTWCYKDFTSTGSQTFTLPANCDGIVVEAIGGGGAGGAANSTSGGASYFGYAPGGGGGAYARTAKTGNYSNQQLTIVVGDGGSCPEEGSGDIKNGESSYVQYEGVTWVLAVGGTTANRVTGNHGYHQNGPGGAGGQASACTGDVKYSGGQGSVGTANLTTSHGLSGNRVLGGAGGGAASGCGNGLNGYTNTNEEATTQPVGGAAGVTCESGLIAGVNWLAGGAGANGTCGSNGWESEIQGNPAGGGGAGTRTQDASSNGSHKGSPGARGAVRVWYHISKNDVQLAVTPETPASCSGESVDLQASSSKLMGTASYAWNTGATGTDITVNPTTTTTYTVTLTDTYDTDNIGCVATLTKNVTVTVASAFNSGAIATTGQTRNYGVGTNDQIGSTTAATGGDNNISYQWYQDGAEITGATSATYTPTVTEPGTYVFTRKAKDGTCVELTASTGSWTLTINNVTVSIDTVKGAKAFCAGGSTTLTAEATAYQGTISYEWNNGATTATTTVTAAGNYTVTASVTVGGVTKTDTKTVTVTVYDAPTFTVTTTPESCKGHDGKATVSPEFVAYAWSNGDDAQEVDTLTSLANGGVYTVMVTDANGCQASKNVTITLNNTLAMDPITGPVVCPGTEFTIFPDDVPEGTTYSWPAPSAISGISGLAAGEDEPSIHGVLTIDPAIITTPTPVSYTVTPKNGICTGNAIGVSVTVTTTVNPGVTITVPATMTKCAGDEVEIPAEFINSVTPHSVKWVLKGTTDTITHANLTVNKDTLRVTLPETCSAEYSYLVFDADNSGCVASDGCVITVNSGTWTLEPNVTVDVDCAAQADVQPASSLLPTITDACGNAVTPTYNGSTRYVTKNSNNIYTLTKVVHIFKYKACDGTSKTWKYTAVVNDVPPVVTCNANVTKNTDAGENFATITLDAPAPTDVCGTTTYEITYSPAAPTNATSSNASGQYPMGTTTVTYTATDNVGQTASCSFTVTVSDNEAPTIVAPADVEVDNYNDVPAPFTTLDEFIAGGGTATDNVGIAPTSFHYTNVSDGNKCPETFTRTYFISDNAGNESSDVQLVVVNDDVAPTFTAPAPILLCRALDGTFDAEPSITGQPDPATFADNNSAVADLILSYKDLDTLPNDNTDMRVIRRQWKLVDECENAGTQIQNIGIYPAITAEKANFTCPADVNEILPFGQCEMEINIGEATYGDFFGQTLTLTNNAPVDNIYPEGVTTVTWTLTDECGFSVSCDQTITVTFPECPVAIDADGNEYESVRIGCDCWTKRNLESLTYSDDTEIPGVYNYVSDMYPNEADNVATFGRLYDWASVIKDGADNEYGHVQGICPEGWYLPTAEKFAELSAYGADALKSPDFWLDGGGSNSTGFSSLPAGYYDGSIDRYMNLMGEAYYWSASKVDDEWTPVPCNIRYICNQVIGADYMSGLGYSVRCIKEKDAESTEPTFTCGTSTVSDVDGNSYNTVKIGNQCWMKENLKTTKKPNGDAITDGVYAPNGDDNNVATYGRLYTWATMMNGATSSEANPSGVQGLCPTGWHVPSDAEWTALTAYVGSQTDYQCNGNTDNIAKALASKQFGNESSVDCAVGNILENNNATGFSALAAGYAGDLDNFFNRSANFWSATNDPVDDSKAYYRYIYNIEPGVTATSYRKVCSFSVRCLKD